MSKKIELCSVASVCEFFGKSPSTIWRWVELGLIPKPVKYGNKTYWEKSALMKASKKVSFYSPKMVQETSLNELGQTEKGIGKFSKATIENLPQHKLPFNKNQFSGEEK